jgi:hypothetical protein
MVNYELDGVDFVLEFEDGGKRDTYYKNCPRFKHKMPTPKGLKVVNINTDRSGRVSVRLSDDDDKSGPGVMDIDVAVAKVEQMPWVKEQLKKQAEAVLANGK